MIINRHLRDKLAHLKLVTESNTEEIVAEMRTHGDYWIGIETEEIMQNLDEALRKLRETKPD